MRTIVLAAVACLLGGTVDAQSTAESRARTAEEARRAEAAARRAETEVRRAETAATRIRDRVLERVMVDDSAMMNRATLGVSLGGAANKRDTLGVFVEAVAENGPAERAGIYEGHRIAFINNIDVRASAADAGDSYLSGVGRHRLMRAMRDVTPGTAVTLRVWTGSGYRDVQVTAARFADVYKDRHFGAMSLVTPRMHFGPTIEHFRWDAPDIRRIEVRPRDSVELRRRVPSVRRTTPRAVVPAPAPRPAPAPPRGPSVWLAPTPAPGVIYAPRVIPSQNVRRYTI